MIEDKSEELLVCNKSWRLCGSDTKEGWCAACVFMCVEKWEIST